MSQDICAISYFNIKLVFIEEFYIGGYSLQFLIKIRHELEHYIFL